MATEQSKLYRSNIQFHPITVKAPLALNESSDYLNQSRQLSPQRKIYHQTSQKHLKLKHQQSTEEGTKKILPYLNENEIENTTFISIDEGYLIPRINKVDQVRDKSRQSRILHKNLTEIHSDAMSMTGKSVRSFQAQDEYYKYWKAKAHEYLDQNFKLREENKKLKSQLEILQKEKVIEKPQTNNNSINDQTVKRGEKSFLYLQNIFKNKLNELQNSVKEKSQKIILLEDKLLQLNRKLLGQQERTQLIERLGKQIDTLTQQNISLKKMAFQYENQQKKNTQEVEEVKYRNPYARYRSKQKSAFGSNNNRRSSEKLMGKNRV